MISLICISESVLVNLIFYSLLSFFVISELFGGYKRAQFGLSTCACI
jgi:hypothetical protein